MKRALDLLLVALLLLALGLAARLWRPAAPATAVVLLDGAGGQLERPGGTTAALATGIGEVGGLVSVEDLARLALALERGELGAEEGVAPLSAAERQALAPAVASAMQHRDALLQHEARLREAEAELDAAALGLLAGLAPAQQRWLLEHRDEVSVVGIEQAYWDQLAATLSASAP